MLLNTDVGSKKYSLYTHKSYSNLASAIPRSCSKSSPLQLMTVTHVKMPDKEAVSNMLYFGAFNRMCVHFHFYITHEAACDSLHDLNFCSHILNDMLRCMDTPHYHLSQYIEIYILL